MKKRQNKNVKNFAKRNSKNKKKQPKKLSKINNTKENLKPTLRFTLEQEQICFTHQKEETIEAIFQNITNYIPKKNIQLYFPSIFVEEENLKIIPNPCLVYFIECLSSLSNKISNLPPKHIYKKLLNSSTRPSIERFFCKNLIRIAYEFPLVKNCGLGKYYERKLSKLLDIKFNNDSNTNLEQLLAVQTLIEEDINEIDQEFLNDFKNENIVELIDYLIEIFHFDYLRTIIKVNTNQYHIFKYIQSKENRGQKDYFNIRNKKNYDINSNEKKELQRYLENLLFNEIFSEIYFQGMNLDGEPIKIFWRNEFQTNSKFIYQSFKESLVADTQAVLEKICILNGFNKKDCVNNFFCTNSLPSSKYIFHVIAYKLYGNYFFFPVRRQKERACNFSVIELGKYLGDDILSDQARDILNTTFLFLEYNNENDKYIFPRYPLAAIIETEYFMEDMNSKIKKINLNNCEYQIDKNTFFIIQNHKNLICKKTELQGILLKKNNKNINNKYYNCESNKIRKIKETYIPLKNLDIDIDLEKDDDIIEFFKLLSKFKDILFIDDDENFSDIFNKNKRNNNNNTKDINYNEINSKEDEKMRELIDFEQTEILNKNNNNAENLSYENIKVEELIRNNNDKQFLNENKENKENNIFKDTNDKKLPNKNEENILPENINNKGLIEENEENSILESNNEAELNCENNENNILEVSSEEEFKKFIKIAAITSVNDIIDKWTEKYKPDSTNQSQNKINSKTKNNKKKVNKKSVDLKNNENLKELNKSIHYKQKILNIIDKVIQKFKNQILPIEEIFYHLQKTSKNNFFLENTKKTLKMGLLNSNISIRFHRDHPLKRDVAVNTRLKNYRKKFEKIISDLQIQKLKLEKKLLSFTN